MRKSIITVSSFVFLIALFFVFMETTYAQQRIQPLSPNKTENKSLKTSQPLKVDQLKNLTPQQQELLRKELEKSGGALTPEAVKAIQSRPEFRGLTPEDIAKGKELLEKKEQDIEKIRPADVIPQKAMPEKAPAVEAEKQMTLYDRMKKVGGYQEISIDLKPFGYDFFRAAAVEVVTQRQDLPVPANYIMGPGDEVKIFLWGRVNEQYKLVVDNKGNITIPQIGPVPVAGMTFEEMSKNVIQQVEKIIGAGIDITAGSLKNIPIFVLGDVKRPGSYNVGSFATITDALQISGGPSDIGSMRNVQLKRKGKIVTTFDIYDLLLKGDKSKDVVLLAGDVVFVPVTGPLVGIAGNVKRPAIYEMKGKHDLHNVIELAGGILPTAYTQQIQVERIVKNERQVVIDLDDKRLSSAKDFMLSDADLVKVFNIAEKEENIVFLNGNVKRPGKYEYRSGMKLKDLVRNVSDLQDETYMGYALIKRFAYKDANSELIPFNLGKLLLDNDQTQNVELRPRDSIYIFSRWFFRDKPTIIVDGGVRSGGEFDLVENVKVRDAILLAGGITRDASLDDLEIYRVDKDTNARNIIRVNLKKALDGDPGHNIILQDLDRITVKKIYDIKQERLVTVDGEVVHPGRYAVQRGEKLSSLLERAGGYTEHAYLKGAVFTRVKVKEMQQKALDEMIIRVEKDIFIGGTVVESSSTQEIKKVEMEQKKQFVESLRKAQASGRMSVKLVHLRLLKGSAFDIELEDGDVLNIPTKNNVVSVTGAVMSQGSYVYLDGMDYSSYVDIAGGYSRYADKSNVFVLKVDGTAKRVKGGFMNWSQTNERWELAAFSEDKGGLLDPGDTIIVPEKLERIAWLRELKDWTQILMNMSVLGATVNYMFK